MLLNCDGVVQHYTLITGTRLASGGPVQTKLSEMTAIKIYEDKYRPIARHRVASDRSVHTIRTRLGEP
jgi:hypothetical protein